MFFTVIRIVLIVIACAASGFHAVNYLQAEKFQTKALWEHFRKPLSNPLVRNLPPSALIILLDWYLPMLLSMAIVQEEKRSTLCGWIVLGIFAVAAAIILWRKSTLPVRRRFTLTRRVLRLLIVVTALDAVGTVALTAVSLPPYLFYAVCDYTVWIAAILMRPVENAINARYAKAARAKLSKRKKLIKVAIAGSFGKTETKQILKTILSEKYEVLATPPAFSTSVGISRVVNEQLNKKHRVFIAELGGENRSEIRDMMKLVSPRFGILTSIGLQHGGYDTVEQEAQANYELIRGLPDNGAAFFGAEGSYCNRLFAICKKEKFRCGVASEGILPDIRIEDAVTGIDGTDFTLVTKDGERMPMHTRLIGRFSLRNIALCAGLAIKLGLTQEQITAGVEKLKPMPHRLQILDGDIHVIDDSDNENAEAAQAGLNVLEKFPGKRILLTCGFENPMEDATVESHCYNVGLRAAEAADYIILVGAEETRAIMQGLMEAKYPKSEIRIVEDIEDAVDILNDVTTKGDSVLWEGISPDYAE